MPLSKDNQERRTEIMRELLELYLAFLKIGCVNFGGGYAMLPLLERELVTKKRWTTMEELRDYYAVGQCTPGVIALNVSTFIGHKRKGVPGALVTACGFLTGPVAIILVIAAFLKNFAELAPVQHAFAGIRVCVCVLIFQAILRLFKSSVVDRLSLVIYLLVLAAMVLSMCLPVRIPAAILVVAAGVFGLLFGRSGKGEEGKDSATKEEKA